MAIYYIRRSQNEDPGRAALIESLVKVYDLISFQVLEIVVKKEDEAKLDPILSDLAVHVVKEKTVVKGLMTADEIRFIENKSVEYEKNPKRGRKGQVMPKEICPECARLAPMTKKGYCKVCAMKKAREARKNEHTVITDRDPNAIIARHGAIGAHRLG